MNENTRAHLFRRLEHVAAEQIARRVPGDVAEDLQVLRVVRHVEDPGANHKSREKFKRCHRVRHRYIIHHASGGESRSFSCLIGSLVSRANSLEMALAKRASLGAVTHESSASLFERETRAV